MTLSAACASSTQVGAAGFPKLALHYLNDWLSRLRDKPARVRFRFLDPSLAICGIRDLESPLKVGIPQVTNPVKPLGIR